jgi:hypothetical protein
MLSGSKNYLEKLTLFTKVLGFSNYPQFAVSMIYFQAHLQNPLIYQMRQQPGGRAQ